MTPSINYLYHIKLSNSRDLLQTFVVVFRAWLEAKEILPRVPHLQTNDKKRVQEQVEANLETVTSPHNTLTNVFRRRKTGHRESVAVNRNYLSLNISCNKRISIILLPWLQRNSIQSNCCLCYILHLHHLTIYDGGGGLSPICNLKISRMQLN